MPPISKVHRRTIRRSIRGQRAPKNGTTKMKLVLFTLYALVGIFLVYATPDKLPFRWKLLARGSGLHAEVKGYVVNTSGCRIPDFDPYDRTVSGYYQPASSYECPSKPSFIRQDGNVLFLDAFLLKKYYNATPEKTRCIYNRIGRNDSSTSADFTAVLSRRRHLRFGRPLHEEQIKVKCFHEGFAIHDEFLLLPVLKRNVESRCEKSQERDSDRDTVRMNIVVLGLDAVSRLNSMRHLQQTRKYLAGNFEPIELFGFTKVGDNSFPNQLAMLTGQTYQEGLEVCRKGVFDDEDFIWKTYANRGYRTMFFEESPDIGLFTFLCHGFYRSPTDYYSRPLLLAIDHIVKKKTKHGSGMHCVGSKIQTSMYLDYTTSLLKFLGNRSYFTYTWISDVSHDILNSAGYADEPFRKAFETLSQVGVMDRSLVVFVSDHGLRYGGIRHTLLGKYEDRLPFCLLLFPPEFRQRYPQVVRNLRVNQHRLTTPYDVHATLLELAGFPRSISETGFSTKRGLSLLHEIPENRTCKDAFIHPHYCCCRMMQEVSPKNSDSWKMAELMVKTVNVWLSEKAPGLCRPHVLKAVLDVRKVVTDGAADTSYFWVTVVTRPGEATLEGTVVVNDAGDLSVETIVRLNMYRTQSYCLTSSVMERFCVCK